MIAHAAHALNDTALPNQTIIRDFGAFLEGTMNGSFTINSCSFKNMPKWLNYAQN